MYIKVRVFPDFHSNKIEQVEPDLFKVFVRASAKNGEANRAVCDLIFKHFGNPAGGVKIVSGHTGPSKLLQVGNED